MGFGKMMELLQEKNKGKIVLCNCGNFYIATGKDAITLYESLNLQLSCFKQEICKVGFPIASLEKYTDMIQEKGYGYIVYYFDKQKEELEKIKEYQGKEIVCIEKTNRNCYICKHSTKYYKKEDIYVKAVAKLYESEKEKNDR